MELGNFVNSYSKSQQWSELMLTSGLAIEHSESFSISWLFHSVCLALDTGKWLSTYLSITYQYPENLGFFFYYLKKLTFISLLHKQLQNFFPKVLFYFFKYLSKCSTKISKLCFWKHRTIDLGLEHSMAEVAIHNYSIRIVKSH